MKKKTPKNLTASIHQRLLNNAHASNREFNEILQYFGMERLLYRLSKSIYANDFTLKGALMLRVWGITLPRPTMDIDLLGRIDNDLKTTIDVFANICDTTVEADGVQFEVASIRGEPIIEAAAYAGIRIYVKGSLGNSRLTIHLDIGFGDVVVPDTPKVEFPTILDFPAPTLHTYSRESAIAEKFEAMVRLGLINSRMKDFYDIWLLSTRFDFDRSILSEAIRQTFQRRDTEIPENPIAFTEEFSTNPAKENQWRAFVARKRIDDVPTDLAEVVRAIKTFLQLVINDIKTDKPKDDSWKAPGPWQSQRLR
ncbi:MAG: nucleotidyl transferase AbiEii/AbiGii toxin family protein [Candidatus Hatepunaea meridiana]|nr:nucleotidyl transferase AbiEii/AbiGii toxin family protein [Candidatus Hatepunaea meridiana]